MLKKNYGRREREHRSMSTPSPKYATAHNHSLFSPPVHVATFFPHNPLGYFPRFYSYLYSLPVQLLSCTYTLPTATFLPSPDILSFRHFLSGKAPRILRIPTSDYPRTLLPLVADDETNNKRPIGTRQGSSVIRPIIPNPREP